MTETQHSRNDWEMRTMRAVKETVTVGDAFFKGPSPAINGYKIQAQAHYMCVFTRDSI